MSDSAVYAAGAVVWRRVEGKLRILLIHRTKYRDVTFPKGKVDPGEMLAETAAREVEEETGIRVHLGVPVAVSRYFMRAKRQKVVHYWAAEATEDAILASSFVPNGEIAALEWVGLKKARTQLSYPIDIEVLDAFIALVEHGGLDTVPLVVLRHAQALPRSEWDAEDATRPLTGHGRAQAKAIVGALMAFGIQRIVTSDALRCTATVKPLAKKVGVKATTTPLISQNAWESGEADVRKIVGKRVRVRKPAVICSHRPLMQELMTEVALATGTIQGSYIADAAALSPAAFSVVHISATHPGSGIIAIETHEPKA